MTNPTKQTPLTILSVTNTGLAALLAALLSALLFVGTTTVAHAQKTNYVKDSITVPLRSGPSSGHRIVHRGVPSGTRLTVLQEDEITDYVQVKLGNGTTGWIKEQYLQSIPTAATRLAELEKKYDALTSDSGSMAAQLASANEEKAGLAETLARVTTEHQQLSEELIELKALTANTVKINRDNKTLTLQNQEYKDQLDLLNTETAHLRAQLRKDEFLNGAFAVLIGVMITLLVPRLWPKKKSDWG